MQKLLPADWRDATLVGRLETDQGPTPIVIRRGRVSDVSRVEPTVSALLDAWDPGVQGDDLGDVLSLSVRPAWGAPRGKIRLMAPIDLQCVKAAGVTFAESTIERVIEEKTRGNAREAQAVRQALIDKVGAELQSIVPGSEQAERLKAVFIADGLWSQYLEVAIGPYAEVFTKAPPMSSVGWGDYIGIRSDSTWNNPEPEVVLVCDSRGCALGATLGNDVNLRDFEGRSALLLGKSKDNNASCSIGPLIRMFDDSFCLNDLRSAVIALEVTAEDGYRLDGSSSMAKISRDPLELVRQTMSEHQYPDGMVLFLGTLFAPIQDRDIPGAGFTHKLGDTVRISTSRLGTLENRVTTSKDAPPWTFGVSALMRNLATRGLLRSADAGR
jgi:fumarylacetoacetate (FAA) hydrolase family protein